MSSGTAELTRSAAAAGQAHQRRGQGVRSKQAAGIADELLRQKPQIRRSWLHTLDDAERVYVFGEVEKVTGSLYGLWHDDPAGFAEDVLGDTLWSTQRQVLDSYINAKRLIVPAGFGLGKTFLAARAVAHLVCTRPVGVALAVTTATRWRQVRNQLWPHIRVIHARAGLPGTCLQTEWWMPDANGLSIQVAYGFSSPANDEAAMQGVHSQTLLLVVDEAGGFDKTIGRGTNNLLTGDARMLAIGNPPTDSPRSWFEEMAEEGELGEEPGTKTISMPVPDNPRITGEPTPVCRDCQPNLDGHNIALHLPDADWVDRTIREHGEEHPYVTAKVYAKFPKDGGDRAIPVSWVEAGIDSDDPEGPDYMRLCDLGLPDETDQFTVARGAWVRLGVDVAAAGGDEFAVSRCIGDVIHERHHSSGSANASAVVVAEKVLEEIHAAERLTEAIGSPHQVRVKVDVIGVGWGVVSMLERWGPDGTGAHNAVIVGVNVAENIEPSRRDEGAMMQPYRKRDEMWLAGRAMLQLDPGTHTGRIRLRVSTKTAAQFSGPNKHENSQGLTVIESKKSMRARGVPSPDRAESSLLAVYEPFPIGRNRRRGLLN